MYKRQGYAAPALENVTLWHERDISHSSVERIMAPDANIILDFALSRLNNVISNLVVYPKNMKKNLDRLKKLPMSEGLMLAMTQKGLSREKAYKIVQRNAMKVWKTNEDFEVILNRDSEIKKYLNVQEIKKILDIKHAIRNTNHIFKKVFK